MNAFTALCDDYAAAQAAYMDAEFAVRTAADARAVAVAGMADAGLSLAQIGALIDVASRGRVNELVKRGRQVLEPCRIAHSCADASVVLEELRGRVRAGALEALQYAESTLPGGRDDLRMRRPERVMGETDFLALLHRGERDRLTRFGAWITPKRGQTPDNLAAALRDYTTCDPCATDDQILADVWLPITRTIDAATVVARGNVPNMRRIPDLNLDNLAPAVAAEGWRIRDLLADDAVEYVSERLAA